MTYISPIIRAEFNMLTKDLRREIWARNLCLYNFQDLRAALESIEDSCQPGHHPLPV